MRYINACSNFATQISCVLLLLIAAPAVADDFEFVQGLRNIDYRLIKSESIGRSFHVYTMLPDGYQEDPKAQYQTIYLLDGGLHLPLLGAYHRYLTALGEIRPAIIVAISYGSDTFEGGNHRSTDFTAPSEERDYWGGAAKYLEFLAEELIPLIEASYRSDRQERVLFGQSLGGQFVLYTAQTRPNLFRGYIASNPALHRNLDFFLQQRPPTSSDAMLFVGTGTRDVDRFLVPRNRWIDHWESVDDKPWRLKVEPLIDHEHASAPPAAFRRGLAWINSSHD